MTTQQRMRRFWIAAHLYLGLSVGLIFALTGLTGSALVFYLEIDRMLNPALQVTPMASQRKSYEDVLEALQKAFPERRGSWRLEVPRANDQAIIARYYKPKERAHLGFAPLMVAVNPYTAEVINQRFWGDYAMTWIYDLHYTLLMDQTGRVIMGVLGLFCLISIATGVYLWWPKHAKFRAALSLRWRSGVLRKLYDIHTLTGMYTLALLLILILSGLLLEVPQWFTPAINNISPLAQKHVFESVNEDGFPAIAVDEAVEIAQAQFPDAQLRWIETPQDDFGVFVIRFKQLAEVGNRFPKSYVWLDQYTGEVLAVQDALKSHAGDTFMDWQHPLHSGEAFGLFGRLLVFFSGFIPITLLITGYLRWKRKL